MYFVFIQSLGLKPMTLIVILGIQTRESVGNTLCINIKYLQSLPFWAGVNYIFRWHFLHETTTTPSSLTNVVKWVNWKDLILPKLVCGFAVWIRLKSVNISELLLTLELITSMNHMNHSSVRFKMNQEPLLVFKHSFILIKLNWELNHFCNFSTKKSNKTSKYCFIVGASLSFANC